MIFDCYKPTFARRFVAASSQYLRVASPAVSALPITMACWFNKVEANQLRALMSLGNSGSANNWHQIAAGSTALIQASSRTASGTATGSTTATYRASTWHHAAGVFASATSRTPYLDGEPGTENTSSRAPTINTTVIGASEDNGVFGMQYNGYIAWPAIWNIALSTADLRRLANGAHPTTIKPENLVAFWDWSGGETEFGLRAAFPLINTGTTPVNGPAFLRTCLPRPWLPGAGFVAGGSPVTVTPTTASLTVSTFAPTVSTPVVATPSALTMNVTTFAPTVLSPVACTPPPASLTISTLAPVVSTPVVATPDRVALFLETFAPSIGAPVLLVPSPAALSINTFAPVIGAAGPVPPSVASISVLADYSATITVEPSYTAEISVLWPTN